jgi:hypothetical protein
MGIYQKLAAVTAGAALSLVVSEAIPTQAATITYDFTLTLTSGVGALQSSVGNQYSGFFSYDDSQIYFSDPRFGGFGYTTYPTDFSLNFNNINYTEANLFPYTRGRGGTFLEFTDSGDSFQLVNFGLAAANSGNAGGFNLNIFQNFAYGAGGFFYSGDDGQGSGSVMSALRAEPVPEPDTVLGISVLGFFGWFLKKKKVSSKQLN